MIAVLTLGISLINMVLRELISFWLMISKIDQLPLTQLGSLPRKEPASVRTETNIGFLVSAVSAVSAALAASGASQQQQVRGIPEKNFFSVENALLNISD